MVSTIRQLGYAIQSLTVRSKRDPWRSGLAWLPLQERYLKSQSRYRLLRTGNQIGKTTAALADVLGHALGEHPYRMQGRDKSGEYFIVCTTWPQSVAIQAKLYALIPKNRLHSDTVFTSIRGFKGKNPAVQVKHVDGTYSTIRFKTSEQSTLSVAGATIDGLLLDEPPPNPEIYAELAKRTSASGGWVSLSLTPIGADLTWLREMVEAGKFEDIHAPLSVEQFTPVGATRPRRLPDGTPMDQEWLDNEIAMTLPHQVAVRILGGWECSITGRLFSAFKSSGLGSHVHENVPRTECRLVLGIDHGTLAVGETESKQIAVLMLVDESRHKKKVDNHSRIYVLDEFSPEEDSTPEQDARGILAMLARHQIEWSELDEVWGDRTYERGAIRKSNADLHKYLARELGIHRDKLKPIIKTVKKGAGRGAGSVDLGVRYMHAQMVRASGFAVHPRCKRVIGAIDRWDYRFSDCENKDPIDGVRYGLQSFIYSKRGPNIMRHQTALRVR